MGFKWAGFGGLMNQSELTYPSMLEINLAQQSMLSLCIASVR